MFRTHWASAPLPDHRHLVPPLSRTTCPLSTDPYTVYLLTNFPARRGRSWSRGIEILGNSKEVRQLRSGVLRRFSNLHYPSCLIKYSVTYAARSGRPGTEQPRPIPPGTSTPPVAPPSLPYAYCPACLLYLSSTSSPAMPSVVLDPVLAAFDDQKGDSSSSSTPLKRRRITVSQWPSSLSSEGSGWEC